MCVAPSGAARSGALGANGAVQPPIGPGYLRQSSDTSSRLIAGDEQPGPERSQGRLTPAAANANSSVFKWSAIPGGAFGVHQRGPRITSTLQLRNNTTIGRRRWQQCGRFRDDFSNSFNQGGATTSRGRRVLKSLLFYNAARSSASGRATSRRRQIHRSCRYGTTLPWNLNA